MHYGVCTVCNEPKTVSGVKELCRECWQEIYNEPDIEYPEEEEGGRKEADAGE